MFKEAFNTIKDAQNIVILPHKDADGDALGCAFALKLMLVNMGKNAVVICEEDKPHRLMETLCDLESGECEPDLVISVDSSDLERLGTRAEMFENAGGNTICFDHHKTCTYFGETNCVIPNAGACGEVIYRFAAENGIEITPEIANDLYLAISSDTGGFRQANATPDSLEIGASLIRKGANSGKINTALFQSNTINRTRLLADVLDKLIFDEKNGIALVMVTREQQEQFSAGKEDCEGLVNYARSIVGVKIGICLRENDKRGVKASLRSNDDSIDVSVFASQFGGGGHVGAAGCEFADKTISEVTEIILQAAKEFIVSNAR